MALVYQGSEIEDPIILISLLLSGSVPVSFFTKKG